MWIILTGGVGPPGQDMDSAWLAAMRLRDGEPLYSPDPATGYSYSPWFAWIWVPLTFLPPRVVFGAWLGLSFAAWYLTLRWSRPSLQAVLLCGPLTFYSAWLGNVQPVMLAVLIVWWSGRWGPAIVGAAASLKAAPILLVAYWVGKREWSKVAFALFVFGVLAAPSVLYGLDRYPFRLDPQASLRAFGTPIWAGVALCVAASAVAVARGRFGKLAAAVAVIAARPNLLSYDVGYALLGLDRAGSRGVRVRRLDGVSRRP